ncbi:outer membrane protein assembly factor BamA [Abditibacteriota bacterium]|nr:outer membrane protein assembly factor BamA [Abditibacteriota bacterium]
MNASPFRRTTISLVRHRRITRVSPFALTLLALPLGAPFAHAKHKEVRLAQVDGTTPAATPEDQPRGLQTPTGPVLGPGQNAPTNDPQNNSTVVAPPPTVTPIPVPDAPSIIGDVQAAEGREITEVRVVGNRVVPSETILTQVRTQRASAFSSRQVDLDRSRIDQLGFFASVQAQVSPDVTDPEKVVVTYIVVENRVVTGFKFTGNTVLKSDDLQKTLVSKTGIVLNRQNVAADVTALQKAYSDKGFAVLVQNASQDDAGVVSFILLEAKLTQIKLSGLTKTKPSLVRKLITTPVNEPFDASKLRRDLSRLYDTSFFEDATFKIDDDPDLQGGVIATFLLKEKRTGQFGVGLGFDSRSKISGFVSVGENNFRGNGTRVAASLEAGSRRNYELSYGNPFVGKRNGSFDVSVYSRSIFREPRIFQGNGGPNVITNSFEEQRRGGRINIVRPLDNQRTRNLIFGIRDERATLRQFDSDGNETNTPILVNGVPFVGSGTILAPSIGYLRDARDSRLDPTRGGRELITIEQGLKGLGGSSSFTKLDIDLRRYFPLTKPKSATELPKVVLAGRVVLGRALNQLPAFEQYFIGGPDTVRGYQTDEQFGDNQYYGNLELRYRFNRQIQGVLFSDAGSAFGGTFTNSGSANLLYSVGFGVRLQTPIGPVRLDYGIGKDGGQTHFAIGPTF